MDDTPPILPYATPDQPGSWKIGLPVFFGLLQFVWVANFLVATWGWDAPKDVVWDSLFWLLTAVPSIVAFVTGFRGWYRHLFKTRNTGAMVVSLIVWAISALIIGWLGYTWIKFTLLDPHGRWHPM